jgi:hypothetical protein
VSPATSSVQSLATRAASGIFESIFDVARTLPPHLLLSLIYRVAVLHLAARIVPVIRKNSMGWGDGMDDGVVTGFWDGRSLGEEPAVSWVLAGLTVEHASDHGGPVVSTRHSHCGVYTFVV